MRVAYVSTDLGVPICGRKGCSVHVQEIVRALTRGGAQVDLFSTNCDGAILEDAGAVTLHPLPRPPMVERAEREAGSIALNADWRAALEKAGRFDFVYERYALWGFAGMEYARANRIPGVLEVNSPLIEEQRRYRVLLDRAGAEFTSRKAFQAAAVLVAVSDEVAAYLGAFPETRGKVHIIPNGVDAVRFSAQGPRATLRDGQLFTIGFVGGLKPWHGLSLLITAFAAVCTSAPQARLLIVGDGPERESLQAQVALEGLSEKVTFTGALPHSKVPELLAAMDVAVAPYPKLDDFYFSPLKIYEYMAAGLPVVASNIGQVAKLIRSGTDGLLVPPGDDRALADALLSLARAPQERERLGAAARERVSRNHTWDSVVGQILNLTEAKAKP